LFLKDVWNSSRTSGLVSLLSEHNNVVD